MSTSDVTDVKQLRLQAELLKLACQGGLVALGDSHRRLGLMHLLAASDRVLQQVGFLDRQVLGSVGADADQLLQAIDDFLLRFHPRLGQFLDTGQLLLGEGDVRLRLLPVRKCRQHLRGVELPEISPLVLPGSEAGSHCPGNG